ncbi:MAG: YCF48-related protein [Thermodesulfobacteriota bacterium]
MVLPTSSAEGAWAPQPFPTGQDLYGVYFVDVNTGYAVGDVGTVVKTVNAGNLWTLAASAGAATLRDVYFIDTVRGWAVGDNGIYMTIDGAASWSGPIHTGIGFNTVTFTTNTTGFAGSQNGGLYWTTDGGITWPVNTATFDGTPVISIEFVDTNNGFLVTRGKAIYSTNDGGTTWNPRTPIGPPVNIGNALDAFWLDTLHGWVAGDGSQELAYTTDGGASWTGVPVLGGGVDFTAIHFTDTLNGWAVLDNGAVMYTTDGGVSWNDPVPPYNAGDALWDIFITPDGKVYAVGTPDSISADTPATPVLTIIKQAWEIGGSTPLLSPTGVPAGGKIVFLIYVKNISSTAVVDPSIIDNLNSAAFGYVADSIYTNGGPPLADGATDLEIFNATDPATGIAQSDAIGGPPPDDFASACTDTGPCPGVATNTITIGKTATNPNNPWGIFAANSTIAFRFTVTIK